MFPTLETYRTTYMKVLIEELEKVKEPFTLREVKKKKKYDGKKKCVENENKRGFFRYKDSYPIIMCKT